MRYIRYFAKHQLLKGDKIVIASKEVLKDNRTVYPFVDSEMLKYADQVHTLLGMGSNLFQKFNYSQL